MLFSPAQCRSPKIALCKCKQIPSLYSNLQDLRPPAIQISSKHFYLAVYFVRNAREREDSHL